MQQGFRVSSKILRNSFFSLHFPGAGRCARTGPKSWIYIKYASRVADLQKLITQPQFHSSIKYLFYVCMYIISPYTLSSSHQRIWHTHLHICYFLFCTYLCKKKYLVPCADISAFPCTILHLTYICIVSSVEILSFFSWFLEFLPNYLGYVCERKVL